MKKLKRKGQKNIAIAVGAISIILCGMSLFCSCAYEEGDASFLEREEVTEGNKQSQEFNSGNHDVESDTKDASKVTLTPETLQDFLTNEKSTDALQPKYEGKVKVTGELVPTYENCSYYFNCSEECDDYTAKIIYKKEGDSNWLEAYEPVYSYEDNQYKGSVVGLEEGTGYVISLKLFDDDGLIASCDLSTTTWSTEVKIAKTITLSELTNGKNDVRSMVISRLNGKEDGWIKIVGDTSDVNYLNGYAKYTMSGTSDNINVKSERICIDAEDAVKIINCSYVIFENVSIIGGLQNSIKVSDSNNIKVVNCDISSYGRRMYLPDKNGLALDSKLNLINYDSGIYITGCEKITVEKNVIHSPRGTSNKWTTAYSAISHPLGPNAMLLNQIRNGIVIRYNDFIGSDAHRYNDVIESLNNTSKTGGINKDSDIYGNTLTNCNDDCIELDGGQENVRVYNNKITGGLAGISIAPNLKGPSYIFRNEIVDLGDIEGKTNYAIKTCGGASDFFGKTFIFNNTFFSKGYIFGFFTERTRAADIVTRNNIFYTTGYIVIHNARNIQQYDFDNDMMYCNNNYCLINEDDSCEKNALRAMPVFGNYTQGLYGLTYKLDKDGNEDSEDGIDDGIIIPNFTDGYVGEKPDMGMYESGIITSYLGRNSGIKASMYKVDFSKSKEYTITISADKLSDKHNVKVISDTENDWFEVKLSSNTINKDKNITCTVKRKDKYTNFNKGTFVVKLDNGDAIAVCVNK